MTTNTDKLNLNMDEDLETGGIDFTIKNAAGLAQDASETVVPAPAEKAYDATRIKESDSEGMAPTVPIDPSQRKPSELEPQDQNPNSQNPA